MKAIVKHCDDYEITISVKRNGEGGKKETYDFVNTLLCWLGESRDMYRERGCNALAKEVGDFYDGLSKVLKDDGYYDDCIW